MSLDRTQPVKAARQNLGEVEPYDHGPARQIALWHEAPDAAVSGVVSVVAHHEIVPLGNDTPHPVGEPSTVFQMRKDFRKVKGWRSIIVQGEVGLVAQGLLKSA